MTNSKNQLPGGNDQKRETNWYVITGGPGCGKTTTVNLLSERGFKTTIEYARHYIDTQRVTGKSVNEIRKNQIEFQLRVLEMQIKQEASLAPGDTTFLDRAIPDSLAYYRFLHIDPGKQLLTALTKVAYKKIFILDLLPLVQDYARLEDETAQHKIHELIIQVYGSLPFQVVNVPVLPAADRVEFILNNL